jgi:hypothetical protein
MRSEEKLTILAIMVKQAAQWGRAVCFRDPAKRGIYVLFPLLLLSLAKASVAQTPQKVTVAYAAISPIFAGVWMAKEIGAFEKHGLKADLIYISSGAITVQAMVGGNLDVSVAASNAVVSAILRGAPLVAVGSITNRPAMSLFVQPDISRPEQLQGKALAITRHGSSTHFLTLFALEKLGLQDKVKISADGRHARSRCGRPRGDGRRRCSQHEARSQDAHAGGPTGSGHSVFDGSDCGEARFR